MHLLIEDLEPISELKCVSERCSALGRSSTWAHRFLAESVQLQAGLMERLLGVPSISKFRLTLLDQRLLCCPYFLGGPKPLQQLAGRDFDSVRVWTRVGAQVGGNPLAQMTHVAGKLSTSWRSAAIRLWLSRASLILAWRSIA